jgi:aspartate aminotransferase
VDASADEILVGPGSKELLFLLQLCFYGEIIVPTPCWVSYTPQSQIVGRNVRFVHTRMRNNWKIKADALAEQLEADRDPLRPRLLVLNSPANPTGVSYKDKELQDIAKVAREYELLILSDEIYSGLHHDGNHVSIARYYSEGTIIANGISKWAGAGGWRLGSFRFPPDLAWLLDAMAVVASETYTSVNAPVQYAAVRAFEGGMQIEQYLHQARRILRTLSDESIKRLKEADIRVVRPDGAFYLYPDLKPHTTRLGKRGIKNSHQMAKALLDEAGVAVLPGADFNREAKHLEARISLVDFDGAEALTRSMTIPPDEPLPKEFLEQCTTNVLDGIDRMAAWAATSTK